MCILRILIYNIHTHGLFAGHVQIGGLWHSVASAVHAGLDDRPHTRSTHESRLKPGERAATATVVVEQLPYFQAWPDPADAALVG